MGKVFWIVVACGLLAIGAFAAWQLSSVEHLAQAANEKMFTLDVDFTKFRQIMVRKNATRAIVDHGGMELLEEELIGLDVDISKDDRPLLNAIRGESQADLWAARRLVVRLTDPELDAAELVLTQSADIQPDSMQVETVSDQAAGKLEKYATTLSAKQVGEDTEVTLHVEMHVRVVVPKAFISTADERVQKAASDALTEQAAAIQQFIGRYADRAVILPELDG